MACRLDTELFVTKYRYYGPCIESFKEIQYKLSLGKESEYPISIQKINIDTCNTICVSKKYFVPKKYRQEEVVNKSLISKIWNKIWNETGV